MSEEAIHVLHVTSRLEMGGVQSFLVNYAKNIDNKKVIFDFAVQTFETQRYDEEIKALGGNIYPVRTMVKSPIGFFCDIYKLCKSHPEIEIVHAHLNYRNFLPLIAARLAGVPIRISHSHSAYEARTRIKKYARKLYQIMLPVFATEYWGCSEKANEWLYGHHINRAIVIHNAIPTKDYLFNENSRKKMREKYGIDPNTFVWIHVGTFGEAKNHKFLLRVFSDYARKDKNLKLFLCGDGILKGEIINSIAELGLADKVILLGMTGDIPELLMMSDIFVFPSLFEGLPLSVVEAETSGLPCVISTAVPQEAIFSSEVRVCKEMVVDLWVEAIDQMRAVYEKRSQGVELAHQAGFDIEEEAKKLEELYINLEGRI